MKTAEGADEPIEVVETLATALDWDDYEAAESVLDPEVIYEVGGETLVGPDAVVASYRRASEMVHGLFDEVGYDHEVVGGEDDATFKIKYRDLLTAEGETHVHLAEQEVTLGRNWMVVKIIDRPLPGERERVDEFMERHGITRPAS